MPSAAGSAVKGVMVRCRFIACELGLPWPWCLIQHIAGDFPQCYIRCILGNTHLLRGTGNYTQEAAEVDVGFRILYKHRNDDELCCFSVPAIRFRHLAVNSEFHPHQ